MALRSILSDEINNLALTYMCSSISVILSAVDPAKQTGKVRSVRALIDVKVAVFAYLIFVSTYIHAVYV